MTMAKRNRVGPEKPSPDRLPFGANYQGAAPFSPEFLEQASLGTFCSRGFVAGRIRPDHGYGQPADQFVIVLIIQSEFVRSRLNPGSFLGALAAAGKQSLGPGPHDVNLSDGVAP